MILKVRPPYAHLVQKPALCGPTCVQIVLLRRGKWVDQEQLAFEMGTRIYKEQKHLYSRPFRIVRKGSPQYGLPFGVFRHNQKLKRVLRRYGLRNKAYTPSEIDDVSRFFKDTLGKGLDVLACFRFDPIDRRRFGHYALVTAFDTDTERVTLCDPYFKNKAMWNVPLNKLLAGMGSQWSGKERGFVVIS